MVMAEKTPSVCILCLANIWHICLTYPLTVMLRTTRLIFFRKLVEFLTFRSTPQFVLSSVIGLGLGFTGLGFRFTWYDYRGREGVLVVWQGGWGATS